MRLTTSRGGPSCGGASVAGGDALRVRPRAGSATAAATISPSIVQRDVDRPVGTSLLAELAGAVERIDDPDAFGAEPDGVVDTLLRQHGVVGVGRGNGGTMNSWERPVALGAEVVGVGARGVHRRPQRDEQLPGLGGDGGGVAVVVGGAARSWRRTLARARSGPAAMVTAGGGRRHCRRHCGPGSRGRRLVVLVLFVLIGRRSHHEDAGVAGFLRVWWPFAAWLLLAAGDVGSTGRRWHGDEHVVAWPWVVRDGGAGSRSGLALAERRVHRS